MRLFLAVASLAALAVGAVARAAPDADRPSCDAVRSAFAMGPFSSREAIVDALQDRLKAQGADKPLGRDGKVQAIVMAVMRCDELGHGDFMTALDRSSGQVEAERAQQHGKH